MTYTTNKEIVEQLNEAEQRLDLLRYELDGWCAWPLIRLGLAKALQSKPQEIISNRLAKKNLRKIVLSDLMGIVKIRKSRYAVKTYTTARRDKVNILWQDVVFDDLLLKIKNYYKIEDINNVPLFLRKQAPLIKSSFTTTLSNILTYRLGSWIKPPQIVELANQFNKIILNEWGKTSFTHAEIIRRLLDFYWQKIFYSLIFKQTQPKYLLLGGVAEFSCIAAARENNITTVEFQHGFLDRYHFVYAWSSYAKSYKLKMPLSEKLFLFGDYWKDELLETGYWREELTSVGSVHFDRYRNSVVRQDNIPCQITLTTQGLETENLIAFLREFLFEIKGKLEFVFNIKMHPHYDGNFDLYKTAFQDYPNVRIITPNHEQSTLGLIAQSDIHVSIFSTSHYEALGLGTPTVILPLVGCENVLHLYRDGQAQLAHTPQELVSIVLNWKSLPVPIHLSNHYYKPNALENIIEILQN